MRFLLFSSLVALSLLGVFSPVSSKISVSVDVDLSGHQEVSHDVHGLSGLSSSSPLCDALGGQCLPGGKCANGEFVSHKCKGAANIRCCVPHASPSPSSPSAVEWSGQWAPSTHCDPSACCCFDSMVVGPNDGNGFHKLTIQNRNGVCSEEFNYLGTSNEGGDLPVGVAEIELSDLAAQKWVISKDRQSAVVTQFGVEDKKACKFTVMRK